MTACHVQLRTEHSGLPLSCKPWFKQSHFWQERVLQVTTNELVNLQGVYGASTKTHFSLLDLCLCVYKKMKQDSLVGRMCLTFSADMKHNSAKGGTGFA